MATTEPKKRTDAQGATRKAQRPDNSVVVPVPGVAPCALRSEPEVVRISHACGHIVHCPREFMPPGRLKRERARNCRSCRKIAREVAALRNRERGLPALDESRGTRDQILLAEELRDRFAAQFEGLTVHKASPAEQTLTQRDPIAWIARFAGQEDCLLESRGPEVCGRACAGDALAEEDAQFDRIFGGGARAQGREEEEGERPEDRGECLCVGCGAYPCRCEPPEAEERMESDTWPKVVPCTRCGAPTFRRTRADGPLLCSCCEREEEITTPGEPQGHPAPKVALIGLARIQPSPLNPRKSFDEAGLEELAASIREHGVMQPLVVRQEGAEFSVIAGERRLRAARLAGLLNVPVIVREADDATALALMLCENLQRENLSPIEEAQAYQGLRDLGWTLEQIGAKVGRSGPAVSNAMRLLALPEEVRQMLCEHKLSAAHGRALLGWADEPERCVTMARNAADWDWSSKNLEYQARCRNAEREREARYQAERAAIAAEDAAEAGSKGGEAPAPESYDAAAISRPERAQRGAETIRNAKEERQAEVDRLLVALPAARKQAGAIEADPRALALLCHRIMSGTRLGVVQSVIELTGPALPAGLADDGRPDEETWALLAAVPPATLLTLALNLLLGEEIDRYRDFGMEARRCRWYVGDGCPAASVVEA
jgi:ParB family chromosome partitioning protein